MGLDDSGGGGGQTETSSSRPRYHFQGLDAVSVAIRGGGGGGDDGDDSEGGGSKSGAVVEVSSMDVSVAGRKLLEDVALRLLTGRRYALVGVNGCGKSTLLRLIAAGRIRANVNDVVAVAQELAARRRRLTSG